MRNSEKNSTIGSRRNIGDTAMNDKLSVFDFADEDDNTEANAKRIVAKFRGYVNDKYNFLSNFAKGFKIQQNDNENKPLVINVDDNFADENTVQLDVAKGSKIQQNDNGNNTLVINVDDNFADESIIQLDGTLSSSSSAYTLSSASQDHLGFKYYSHGARSCSPGARKSGNSLANKKHTGFNSKQPQSLTDVEVHDLDSVDDQRIGLRSSSDDLAENGGSLEELPFESGVNTRDAEPMVVVIPSYVKIGDTYYTKCSLTFSRRCIKLEGQPPWNTEAPCCHEWSISNILNIEQEWCESVNVAVVAFSLISHEGNAAEISNEAAGIVRLEFVVSNATHWFEKHKEIKSLDMKYKASWSTIVSEYNFNECFEGLAYPYGDPDAVYISSRDVEGLQPKTFINDTIIDFYLKYLMNKINPEEQHRFYVFSTFFLQKLARLDPDSSKTWEGGEAFQRICKWTRNVNIFEKHYIFIPVNSSLHWSLIVICHPGKVENSRDEETSEIHKKACILYMDSLKGSHSGLENLIQRYLCEEWKYRHKEQAEDISSKFLNLQFVALELPQQENFFDCGLFLLHYAELFLEQLKKNWFPPDEVSLRKRDYISKLIYKILRDDAKKDVPSATYHSGPSTVQELKSVYRESVGPSTFQMTSTEQCSNPMSPIQEELGEQVAASPEDEASSHEADLDAKSVIVLSSPRSMRMVVEKKSTLETSRSPGVGFWLTIDEMTAEDCDPEVASNSEEDNSACIVEDSEDENERQEIISPSACIVEDSEDENERQEVISPSACIVEDSEDENELQEIISPSNPVLCSGKFHALCYRKAESTARSNHELSDMRYAKKPRNSSPCEEEPEITIL